MPQPCRVQQVKARSRKGVAQEILYVRPEACRSTRRGERGFVNITRVLKRGWDEWSHGSSCIGKMSPISFGCLYPWQTRMPYGRRDFGTGNRGIRIASLDGAEKRAPTSLSTQNAMIPHDASPTQDTPKTSTPGLEILLTASPFLFCILDPDGKLRRMNAAAEAVFGSSQEEVEGLGLGTVLHPDDRARASQAIATVHDAAEGPVTLRAGPSAGPLRMLDLWFSRDPSSDLVLVWGSDVTESRAIRDELRMRIELLEDLVAQRTRLLAEFQTRLEDLPHRSDTPSTHEVPTPLVRPRSSTVPGTIRPRRSPTFLRSGRGSWHRPGSPPRMTMAPDVPLKLLADDADAAPDSSRQAGSAT